MYVGLEQGGGLSLSIPFGWQVCFLGFVCITVLASVVGRWCFCDFWFWLYLGRGFWTNPGVGLARMVDADRVVIDWCKIERGRFVPDGPQLGFPSRWLGCLLFGMLMRVGEACVPGPTPGGSSIGSVGARATFRLGVCNANGVSEKISELYGLNLDLLAVSETHLTDRGLRFFRAQLKVQAPSARWFVHGQPVCPRGVVSDTGKFSGVGLMSRWPAHSLPHDWEPVVYSTGRLSISSAFVHGLWISGCVVYCPPAGPTHPKARHVANSLLGLALDRVLQLSGPRYICGDFNHDLPKLDVIEKFKQAGFIELQELNMQRHAIVPAATCRGKTRRDFCFISAELVPLFSRCDTFSVDWSDHDVLVGTFECSEADRWRFPWPIPSAIPWKELPNRAEGTYVDFSGHADPSVCYRQLWDQTETEAKRVAFLRGKPLHHSCLGRGSRDSPLATKFQVAPIREGRPCDVKPSFLGFSQQHRQWCKQARRLESYVRLVKGWNAHSDADHRSSLWTSILRAPGFRPSFQGWWSVTPGNREFVQFVPDASPSHAVAEQVFLGFDKQFRALEQHLKSHQRYVKQFSKVSPIGSLYKSVRRDPPQPVELLTRTVKGTIAALDFQDAAIEFEADCDWDESVSFVHAGRVFHPIFVTPDKLYVDSLDGFSQGDVVVQTKQTGHLSDLFAAFHAQWSIRWQKHDSIVASQWNDIMEFARSTLSPVQVEAPVLSVTVLQELVRSKSAKTAAGLDGVSRDDLLALSPTQLGSVVSLYSRAEHDGCWPRSCMAGSVRSLAKTSCPQTAGDYRPVTVLSLVYRLWSSFHAKFWLRAINGALHPLLCGNRPGGRTSTVWKWILTEVEQSRHLDSPVSGLVADLVKAFNTLPRLPTMYAAKLIGISHPTVTAWAGALSMLKRHFAIRQSFCQGLSSSTGFPEGCALSCLAMLILDELLHRWLQQLSPSVSGLTFVDNWEVLVRDEQWIQPAFVQLQRFVDMLDLQLDHGKTYFWSTSAAIRSRLRQQGLQVKLSARDLGAHVVYSCQLSNKTLASRIEDLESFWVKLGSASGSFRDKVRVIRTAAWPRAFHACAAVVIGRRFTEDLRTECMKALHLNKPGASPFLQLSLENEGLDPQQWIILDTLRCFRDAGPSVVSELALTHVVEGSVSYVPGLLHEVLYQRIQQLGWEVVQSTVLRDSWGSFDLMLVDWASLLQRAHRAWTLVVARQVSHRISFCHFAMVDRVATRRGLIHFSDYELGVLRRHLNGSLLDNSVTCKWTSSGSDRCVLCGDLDGLDHRLWGCSCSADLRASISEDVLAVVDTLPDVCRLHGWTLRSPFEDVWAQYLLSIPDGVPDPVGDVPFNQIVDVFTDGSCFWQSEPAYRVAAFAVVLAPAIAFDSPADGFRVLAASPLSGLVQTSYRAELMGRRVCA